MHKLIVCCHHNIKKINITQLLNSIKNNDQLNYMPKLEAFAINRAIF